MRKKTAALSAKEKEAIDEGLAVIYGIQGDNREDLTTVEKGMSRGKRVTFILVRVLIALAALAVVAYGAFFVYTRLVAPSSENPLVLTIETPSELVSGSEVDLTVRYHNPTRVPLALLEIDLNLPEEFSLMTPTPVPTDSEELIWNLGTLPGSGEGTLALHGRWVAAVPSTTTVQALATFRPANFNADFTQVATAALATKASALTLAGVGPEKLRPGEEATYVFTVENTGEAVFAPVQFVFDLPAGFYLSGSEPELEAGAAAKWDLGEIAPHATTTVTIRGSFAADIVDVQTLHAAVMHVTDRTAATQAEANVFTSVEGNGVSLQVIGNGTTERTTLDPGDALRLTVRTKNTGDIPLNNPSLLVDFQTAGSLPIVWSDATLDGGRLTADGVRFDNIGILAAGEEKLKNLIFPLKDEFVAGDDVPFTVIVHATVGGVTVKSQPFTVSLNADVALLAAARYYDDTGAPVGEGALPPVVGETTSYQLVWRVTSALHALSDVRVSATLPADVTWMGDARASYGTVAYDDATRIVTWTIADLPTDVADAEVVMGVSITPSEDDAGTFVKLLSGSSLRATDTVTNAAIQLTADPLTTDLAGDEFAEGKGAVID